MQQYIKLNIGPWSVYLETIIEQKFCHSSRTFNVKLNKTFGSPITKVLVRSVCHTASIVMLGYVVYYVVNTAHQTNQSWRWTVLIISRRADFKFQLLRMTCCCSNTFIRYSIDTDWIPCPYSGIYLFNGSSILIRPLTICSRGTCVNKQTLITVVPSKPLSCQATHELICNLHYFRTVF